MTCGGFVFASTDSIHTGSCEGGFRHDDPLTAEMTNPGSVVCLCCLCCGRVLTCCLCWQDYYKALEDADEKVQLANQIYDLVSWPEDLHIQCRVSSAWSLKYPSISKDFWTTRYFGVGVIPMLNTIFLLDVESSVVTEAKTHSEILFESYNYFVIRNISCFNACHSNVI